MARLVREELLSWIQPVQLLSLNPNRQSGEVSGRFRSSGMLFDYSIKGGTVSYKPVGTSGRKDAISDGISDARILIAQLQASKGASAQQWSQERQDAYAETQIRLDRRCIRPDGTYYGTSGECRKGKNTTAAKERKRMSPKAVKESRARGAQKRSMTAMRVRLIREELEKMGKPETWNQNYDKAVAAAEQRMKAMRETGSASYKGYDLSPPSNPPYAGGDAKVAKVTKALRDRIAKLEPAATRLMIDLAEESGAKLEGLAHRLKAEKSLGRKIENEYKLHPFKGDINKCAESMSDVVRYTMKTTNDNYTDTVEAALKKFEGEGWTARVKNYWEAGQPYRGMNVALTSPDGLKVELQFHTPQSLFVKNKTHGLYEQYRVEKDNKKRRQLFDRMVKITDTLIPPWGAAKVGGTSRAQSVQRLQMRAGREKLRLMGIGEKKVLGFQTAEEAGLVRPGS